MPALRGAYTLGNPIGAPRLSESKGYLGKLAQGAENGDLARPLTDIDWNDHVLTQLTILRRALQWGLRSGACSLEVGKVREHAGAVNNRFDIFGDSTSFEAASFYIVGGLPCLFPFVQQEWTSFSAGTCRYLFRRVTRVSGKTIEDTAANWVVNSLVGQSVTLYNPGVGQTTYGIVSNTETTMVLDATVTEAAGVYYRVEPSTPSGGSRQDVLYLGVYLDEIAPAAIAGDPDFDTDQNQNVEGALLESMRPLRACQYTFLDQGQAQLTPNLTTVETVDGVFTYVDSDNNTHYLVELTRFNRIDGGAKIKPDQIRDLRQIAGRGMTRALKDVHEMAFGNAVIQSGALALSQSVNDITVAGGWISHRGLAHLAENTTLNAPTGQNQTSWNASKVYAFYVDVNKNIVAAELPLVEPPAFPAGTTPAGWITTDGGGNVLTVVQAQRCLLDLAEVFKFDSTNKIHGTFDFAPPYGGGDTIPWRVYNNAGTVRAALTAKAVVGEIYLEALLNHQLHLLARTTTTLKKYGFMFDPVNKIIKIYGEDGAAFNGAQADSPTSYELSDCHVHLMRAPALEYGDTNRVAAPIAGPILVPGADFHIETYSEDLPQAINRRHVLRVGDGIAFDMTSLASYHAPIVGTGGKLLLYHNLPLHRGDQLDRIRFQFGRGALGNAEITLRLFLWARPVGTFPAGSPGSPPVLYQRDLTINQVSAADQGVDFIAATDFDFDGAGSKVVDRKILEVAIYALPKAIPDGYAHWTANSDNPSIETFVYFKGLEIYATLRATGVPVTGSSLTANVSSPRRGI